jgi:ribosomal protein S27AE
MPEEDIIPINAVPNLFTVDFNAHALNIFNIKLFKVDPSKLFIRSHTSCPSFSIGSLMATPRKFVHLFWGK